MSDNLLLTILGAVGVGALVMGLNKNDEKIRENWGGLPQFNKLKITGEMQRNNVSTANFAKNVQLSNAVQTIARLQKSGVPQDAQIAQLRSQGAATASRQKAELQRSFPQQKLTRQSVENYASPSELGLGSSSVTRNDYVSYPQFNQSTPLQSPSLNLPAQIRYNPPSLNNMGITESYQSHPMDYAGLVEGFIDHPTDHPTRMNVATYEKNPQGKKVQGGELNVRSVTNEASYIDAMNKGNQTYSDKEYAVQGVLPLSTMDSGVQGNPSVQNVINFDQFIYAAPKRGGWRANSSGTSDLIRGDLAVCVDPCQKGWFQSSLQPANLTVGAMNVLMGSGVSSSNDTTAEFAKSYGSTFSVNQGQRPNAMSTLQKALMTNTSGGSLTSLSSFT